MRGVRVGNFDSSKGEGISDAREGWQAMGRGKDKETYVDDSLCHEFTPSEGIKQGLELSVPR